MEATLKLWLKRLKWHESTVSMLLGALVVIVAGVLLYNFLSVTSEEVFEEAPQGAGEEYSLKLGEEEGELVPLGLPVEHTVARGEHLWKISEKYYGNGYNWVDIAQANSLSNPGLIFSGQKLVIPKVKLRVAQQISTSSAAEISVPITGNSYTVIKGDTLWDIAVRAYQDGYQWPRIYQENRELISDPNLIEVDMQLSIPR
jgi:nucleoid-associated protein YgaU